MRSALVVSCLCSAVASAEVLDGGVPDAGQFFLIPFEVAAGTEELEVRHDDLSSANILDWGLLQPDGGFRGWGGGNPEAAIVGTRAASRSYLRGPIPAGTWNVLVGKAKVTQFPARWKVEVLQRTTATLAPAVSRRPYADLELSKERRWYAGDLHVHSLESGDARPDLDTIAKVARARGLDFVALSDHNTVSHLEAIGDAQDRAPQLLLVPSVEFTTYAGHANAFGATQFVPHYFGIGGVTYDAALKAFARQGAVLTLNHPTLDLGGNCIGCAWELPVKIGDVGAIEIGVGGWFTTGGLFDEAAIAYWESLADRGLHLAPVGGSDDHRAATDPTSSPIGDPTTLIEADGLSTKALVEGLKRGRSVVKLRGPDDPMLTVGFTGAATQDTVVGKSTKLTARATGAKGLNFRWVLDGVAEPEQAVTSNDESFELPLRLDALKVRRARAEIVDAHKPRTVTGHVWLSETFPAAIPGPKPEVPPANSCSVTPGAWLALALLSCSGLLLRARRGSRASTGR